MKVVLVGQPNCGKSTIFNSVAGYRAATGNFPGTSVSYTASRVQVEGRLVEVVDLPGAYSLTSQDEAERAALDYLLRSDPAVVINVIDASRLGRSLELTLQLLELGRPMVVALNMVDEAERKGIEVNVRALERELGLSVTPTVARRGLGLVDLFGAALAAGLDARVPAPPRYDDEIEGATARVEALLAGAAPAFRTPRRLAALKLLERDPAVRETLAFAGNVAVEVEDVATKLEELHGWTGEDVVSGARHALAHHIEERVVRLQPPRPGWRERLDLLLMHPILGIPTLLVVLGVFFLCVFWGGKFVEAPLVRAFDSLAAAIALRIPPSSAVGAVVKGLVLGVSGGVAIALPYLVPFLIGLAVLEDTGYLPRIAYLLDGVMHRLGLHGKSIVPLMLGYGCSAPAVMATRILDNRRDRRITAALVVLIPCSARSTVILGLVGAVLGIVPALAVYVVNLVVVVAVGVALQKGMKGAPPGLVLEVPDLRAPSLGTIGARTWVALREFVVVAWPALVLSSIVLGALEASSLDGPINRALSPLTVRALGLPAALGLTLVFGVLRKELALMMLIQALGTTHLAAALTPAQMMSFALFVMFYVPCVATIATLWRELGWKDTLWISVMSAGLALVVAVAGRFVAGAIF